MTKLYRVLGKRGRITIPFEIRQRVGFTYNDVLSFTESPDGRTVTVKREKICDNCSGTKTADKDAEMTLEDFLDSLSAEQQRVALVICPSNGLNRKQVDRMPEHKPLYRYSLKEAAEWNEKDEWRESYLENCDCARAIERAIDEHYDGQRLNSCAQEIIDRYGFDRVNFVLAATVRQGIHDGRYSEDNKNWSRRFSVMDKEHTWQYHVRSHPGLVNLFIADARRLWDKLGLFDARHCENGSQVDYTDRIVVLDPSILKDECKTPQDQLFYAESGNGCRPNAIGTKVYGFHVSDGEKGYYRRTDFTGALKEEFVPEWAKENTQKYLEPDEPADEPDEDGGMTMNM